MTKTTRHPVQLDCKGWPVEMRPTGEVRWFGATLQQAWAPTRGGLAIWHDVQAVPPAPTSEEVHAWINRAYRQPPGFGPMDNDGSRFTRWNMEVAFIAGWNAARKGVQNV